MGPFVFHPSQLDPLPPCYFVWSGPAEYMY